MRGSLLMIVATCTAFSVLGCGKKSEKLVYGALTQSANESNAAALLQEAVDSAGAGESSDQTTSFVATLTGDQATGFSPTFSCATSGNDAVVTVTGEVNRSFERAGTRVSVSRTVTGSLTETRTWSKSGSSVLCNTANTHAKLSTIFGSDFTSDQGVTLTINNNRTRSVSTTVTNVKKNTQLTKSSSTKVTGTRTVTWASQTTANGVITRVKKVTANTTRAVTKDGATTTWTIVAGASSPLTITVERVAAAPNMLTSKTITGTLTSTSSADATVSVEKTFTNFKLAVGTDGTCTAASGTVAIAFKTNGTATQTYTCTAASGEFSCVDQDNAEVTVEVPDCDPVDNA